VNGSTIIKIWFNAACAADGKDPAASISNPSGKCRVTKAENMLGYIALSGPDVVPPTSAIFKAEDDAGGIMSWIDGPDVKKYDGRYWLVTNCSPEFDDTGAVLYSSGYPLLYSSSNGLNQWRNEGEVASDKRAIIRAAGHLFGSDNSSLFVTADGVHIFMGGYYAPAGSNSQTHAVYMISTNPRRTSGGSLD